MSIQLMIQLLSMKIINDFGGMLKQVQHEVYLILRHAELVSASLET